MRKGKPVYLDPGQLMRKENQFAMDSIASDGYKNRTTLQVSIEL